MCINDYLLLLFKTKIILWEERPYNIFLIRKDYAICYKKCLIRLICKKMLNRHYIKTHFL